MKWLSLSLAWWAQAIINHFYWSIFTCGGNRKIIVDRFTFFLHHIVNKHKFPNKIYYKCCGHEALSEDDTRRKEWLEMGSENHEKLQKILCEKSLLADQENITEQVNTTILEVFHALKITYLPKKTFFGIEKMITDTQIAALDHNHKELCHQGKLTNSYYIDCMFLSSHRVSFRVNPHSIAAWMSRNSLLEAGVKSKVQMTATGLELRTTYFESSCSHLSYYIFCAWAFAITINLI